MPDSPDRPDDEPEPGSVPEDWSPTGLDLARRITRQVNATARRPGKTRRRRTRGVEPRSSGAHPDDRDPQTIGSVLDRLVEERGWRTDLDIHLMIARWPDLIGRDNAAHCKAETYADGVLTVRTSSTAWAVQMRTIAPAVMARINDQLGDSVITRVVVKGPDAPSWSHGRRRVRGRGPRDTYG